jgi:large subunit ribosomal protein L29
MKRRDFEQLENAAMIEELNKLLKEKRDKLERLKFDLAAGKVKNISEVRKIKKDIAQIMTLINEKGRINK